MSTKSSFDPVTPGTRTTRGCVGSPSETVARSPLGAEKVERTEPGAGTLQSRSPIAASRVIASARVSPKRAPPAESRSRIDTRTTLPTVQPLEADRVACHHAWMDAHRHALPDNGRDETEEERLDRNWA